MAYRHLMSKVLVAPGPCPIRCCTPDAVAVQRHSYRNGRFARVFLAAAGLSDRKDSRAAILIEPALLNDKKLCTGHGSPRLAFSYLLNLECETRCVT